MPRLWNERRIIKIMGQKTFKKWKASLTSSIPLADNICWGTFVRQYHTPCPFLCHTCVGNWLHCEWYIAPNPLFLRLFRKKMCQKQKSTRCLKTTEKVSFNIASEASYFYKRQKFIKNAKLVNFGEFLKNIRSNSVTRLVNFNWTKIGKKCQNWKI